MTFDTRPKPAFLLAMQNQKWTISGALSELVDNSFGSIRGDAQKVIITFDSKARLLEVIDGGLGMDEIGRLFQLGNAIGRSPGDIGMYGSGGTMALLWLAKKVSIWTLRSGKVMHDRVDWKKQIASDEFPVISSEWRKATRANTPPELFTLGHGTLIRITLQDKRSLPAQSVSNVTRDLATTYSPGLRSGREIIWRTIGRNGGERVLIDPMPALEKEKKFNGAVEIGSVHLPFKGRFGIVKDLPQSQSLVHIGYGARVIKSTRDCYGSPDSDEAYSGIGVCGYLDLADDWLPYLSTTKDGVDDSRAWSALMDSVFQVIRPLLIERNEEKLDLVFDDLALDLTNSFDGQCDLEVRMARPEGPDGSSDGFRDGGKRALRILTDDDEPAVDEGLPARQRAATQLIIMRASDRELEGGLCRFEEVGSGYMGLVNEGHDFIQECLTQKPFNKKALHLLIINEIANKAVGDQIFCKKIFGSRPKVLVEIAARKSPGSFICRLLMDRVRYPNQSSPRVT